MFVEYEKVPNGDLLVSIPVYECDRCKKYLHDSSPRYNRSIEDGHYCGDCAFITGEIDENEYKNDFAYFINSPFRAYIENDVVILKVGKYTPYDRPKPESRNYPEYTLWRTAVFERDEYTCQHCRKVGGELNAHHIKSYKNYPELRTVLKNGLTLCESCHRSEHRKK